jgi:hypothetical protein
MCETKVASVESYLFINMIQKICYISIQGIESIVSNKCMTNSEILISIVVHNLAARSQTSSAYSKRSTLSCEVDAGDCSCLLPKRYDYTELEIFRAAPKGQCGLYPSYL